MDKTQFLTVFATFESIDVVKQTLPTVVEETARNDARLIVHDSSVDGRGEKWEWLQRYSEEAGFFLLLSTNLSQAHARNMCIQLGKEMFAPDYICVMDDDHGYREGNVKHMIDAMRRHYGTLSPNGLRYGLFTACMDDRHSETVPLKDGNGYPHPDSVQGQLGGTNNCHRCAPTHHWDNVLKSYDTDEYLISYHQTSPMNRRNYHKGFTTLVVQNGELMFNIERTGRATTADGPRTWDPDYTASDRRANFKGKASDPASADK